jgi:hypothetical protein
MSPLKDAIHPRPKGRGILAWSRKIMSHLVYREGNGELRLLPFDGAGWFGGDIINNAVYAPHVINNPIGYPCKHLIGDCLLSWRLSCPQFL